MCIFQPGNFTGWGSEGVKRESCRSCSREAQAHTITGLQERLRERVCRTFLTFVNTEMSACCLLDEALKKVIQDCLVESQVHVHAARM